MKKLKQISALFVVFILIALYITTIVLACFKSPEAHKLFMASLYATFVLPVLIYGYGILYRVIKKRNDKSKSSR